MQQNIITKVFDEFETNRVKEVVISHNYSEYDIEHRLAYIDLFSEIEPPVACLEVVSDDFDSLLGSLGNFSLIIGKAKSRKTYLTSILIAAAIKKNVLMEKIRGNLPENITQVLVFDTEQHNSKVQQVGKRTLKLSGLKYSTDLNCYCLRSFTTENRLNFIEQTLNNYQNVGLVVIDGIRDLVKDINSQSEASFIASKLLKWSEQKNVHIITVLHQNKNDDNARGHLGTELVNKAETTIKISIDSTDKSISKVEPYYCREKEFKSFAFSIDESGLPFIIKDWDSEKLKTKIRLSAEMIQDSIHIDILINNFRQTSPNSYSKTVQLIKDCYFKAGYKFGDNKAKEFLEYLIVKGWFEKQYPASKSYAVYCLSTSLM
jgi:hypothetical protein